MVPTYTCRQNRHTYKINLGKERKGKRKGKERSRETDIHTKYCQEYRATGAFTYFDWECKIMKS